MSLPDDVRSNILRGLSLHRIGFGGKGLRAETISQAQALVAGEAISLLDAHKQLAWFARFKDLKREPRSAAEVAWLLHGGDQGVQWLQSVIKSDAERPKTLAELREEWLDRLFEGYDKT